MVETSRIMQGAFTGGELAPSLYARVDLTKYLTGLKTAKNVFVHAHGGVSNRAGLEWLGAVGNEAQKVRLIPFEFNDSGQLYILEFGHLYMRVWKDGGLLLDGASAIVSVVTPYTGAQVRDLSFAQEADVMYIAHKNHAPRKILRGAVSGDEWDWTIELVDFGIDAKSPTNVVAAATYKYPFDGDATVLGNIRVVAVDADGLRSAPSSAVSFGGVFFHEAPRGSYVRVTWGAVANAVKYQIFRDGGGLLAETPLEYADLLSVTGDATRTAPGAADPGATAGTPTGVNASIRYGKPMRYRVSAVMADTGEESLAAWSTTCSNDLRYEGNYNIIAWDPPADVDVSYYNVYKRENGVFGFIGIAEATANPSFTDDNIVADTTNTPQEIRNPFNGSLKYPRSVTFHEGRLWWGGTRRDPMAIWGSQSANYENLSVSTQPKPSDAVIFRTRGQTINEVRSMVSHKALLVFTSGGVYSVTGGDEQFISPVNILPKLETNRGASSVPPLKVGETVIYCLSRGGIIRDLGYEFANDNFIGNDLTIMARHLFEGHSIVEWAYAEAPYSIIWAIRDDGKLLSLTYIREHEVWAWSQHETDGTFESVAVINEGGRDVPYFVVNRTINGATRRYVERMADRNILSLDDCFFVDCGVTYDGAPATIITGLSHLANKEVAIFADGSVVPRQTVVGGQITLPAPASLVRIGLPYTSEIETLELELGQIPGKGLAQGRMKSLSKVTLRVEKSRGVWIGPDRDHLNEFKQRSTEAWGDPIQLYTGDMDVTMDGYWSRNGGFVVRQQDPLPITILAAFPDVTVGG